MLERDGLTAQQLVLRRQLRRRRADPIFELAGRQLQFRIQPLPFDRFGQVVQDGDDGGELRAAGRTH